MHLRNLAQVQIEPDPGINLLYGLNGSGKSAFVESLHLLGVGRSFRTQRHRRLIQEGETACTVHALLADGTSLGITKSTTADTAIQINGDRQATRAALAARLPFLLFDPTSLEMLSGASQPRRQLLDWALFHVEPDFHAQWQAAKRALLHRNSLLKNGKISTVELDFWEAELARSAQRLDGHRQALMQSWLPGLQRHLNALLPTVPVDVSFWCGWDTAIPLQQQLSEQRDRDRERGFTQTGPHRADLRVRSGGVTAIERLSRGQQKLVVVSLLLSLTDLLCDRGNKPLLLLDDMASELDAAARQRVCAVIADLGVQVFMTGIDAMPLADAWAGMPASWFHVEQGSITSVPQPGAL